MRVLATVGALLLIVLGADAVVAYRAGDQFETQLKALDGRDLGRPGLRLEAVDLHRGFLSSTATADLALPTGAYPLTVPLRLTASQGLALDGSALRVQLRMGDLADTPLKSFLDALHDTDPFLASLRFGLDGGLRRVQFAMTPIHTQLARTGVQVGWDGMRLAVKVDGFYGAGGSADGTLHWAALHVAMPAPANGRLDLGAIDESFVQKGRPTNGTGSLDMTMGPSTAELAGRHLRIDSVSGRADTALHRDESGYTDNPSGLAVGHAALRNFTLKMVLSQPVAGRIQAHGSLDAPQPATLPPAGMDPQQLEQARVELLRGVSGSVDLRASMSLFQQARAPVLARLLQAGYVTQQGSDAVSHIVFGAGHVTVDGHVLGG